MSHILPWVERHWRWVLGFFGMIMTAVIGLSVYTARSPVATIDDGARVLTSATTKALFSNDLKFVQERIDSYKVGLAATNLPDPSESWARVEAQVAGFRFIKGNGATARIPETSFVYEDPDAPHLKRLREEANLLAVVEGARGEFEAQRALGRWVGTRFPHREDQLPPGLHFFDPVALLREAAKGRGYWCEIAAKLTVYAATALGWPSRLATASQDGVHDHDDHAIAEVWSNELNRWYMLDTDYNVTFESRGRPLSAFEFCHDGPSLQREQALSIVPFAPEKSGVDRSRDLLPYFIYTHIDMRNDWLTRRLSRGSPASGDWATWWTARPEFRGSVTVKTRVDDQRRYNWPINGVIIRAVDVEALDEGRMALTIGLRSYAPYFQAFELSVDRGSWQELSQPVTRLVLSPGNHIISARVITYGGHRGPVYKVKFTYDPLLLHSTAAAAEE